MGEETKGLSDDGPKKSYYCQNEFVN